MNIAKDILMKVIKNRRHQQARIRYKPDAARFMLSVRNETTK